MKISELQNKYKLLRPHLWHHGTMVSEIKNFRAKQYHTHLKLLL